MTTNCTHLGLERLPLGVKGSEENAPLYSETQKDVCVCLWFWRFMSSLGKRAVFYTLTIRVKMFVCYRGSPSLLPQKSFRRSGTSSPVQCLSTPFRRLNGSRTPPSGKSISGVSSGLLVGWSLVPSDSCFPDMPVRQQQSATAAAACPRPQGSGAASLFCAPLICTTQCQHVLPETEQSGGAGAVASPGTKPAPAVDTASLEINRGGSIEATPHPGECKAIVPAARGQGPPWKSTAGALGGPEVLLPFSHKRLEQGHLKSCPVMRSGNLEEREEDAPAVQHLPAPLARLQVGAGYWEEAACLLRAHPSALGVQGAVEA